MCQCCEAEDEGDGGGGGGGGGGVAEAVSAEALLGVPVVSALRHTVLYCTALYCTVHTCTPTPPRWAGQGRRRGSARIRPAA